MSVAETLPHLTFYDDDLASRFSCHLSLKALWNQISH